MRDLDFTQRPVRYIKLGRGGVWAEEALAEGTIPFGYHIVPHATCLEGHWNVAREILIEGGRTPAGASQGIRELQDFYKLGDGTLWVTVAQGHLWWAIAEGAVVSLGDGSAESPSRFLPTREGWTNRSLTGESLATVSLSSALTRTANYRMTICEIERLDYLIRRIRGELDPLHAEAMALQKQTRRLACSMLKQLHWQDLETIADLIFSRDGWRRMGVLGQDQPDVDMVLEHATSKQTAWVQVKTKASQSELMDNYGKFIRSKTCDLFYFVCSQPSTSLTVAEEKHVHLWAGDRLAGAAIDAGLFQWLIDRTR